jgi:hypothetical protein
MKRCVLNLVSLVQINIFRLNCSFRDISASSAVTSGLNLGMKRALKVSFSKITGKEAQFRTATTLFNSNRQDY